MGKSHTRKGSSRTERPLHPAPGSAQEAPESTPARSDIPETAAYTPVDLPAGLFPALVASLIYAFTMPRTVTFEDSGLFIMAGHHRGIAHPPGYPLYTLFGNLFETLLSPLLASPAQAYHWLSAVFAGITLFLWVQLAIHFGIHRMIAAASALWVGLSTIFWSQAQIAEVYTMNSALFFGTAWAATRLGYTGSNPRNAVILGLLVGLGLSHHWPLFILSSPFLVALAWEQRDYLKQRFKPILGGFAAGLLPFLYLIIRSNQDPQISFYGPLKTLGRFLHFVLREGYGEAARRGAAPGNGLSEFLASQLTGQFTVVGLLIALLGAIMMYRRHPLIRIAGILGGILGGTFALLAVLGATDTPLNRNIFKVFPVIPYALIGLLIARGLQEATTWISKVPGRAGPVVAGVALLAAAGQAWRNGSDNNLSQYTWAKDYGAAVLDAMPTNAILITHVDTDAGPIGYLRLVENRRPDVEIFNDRDLLFKNRLNDPMLDEAIRRSRWAILARSTNRPVCFTDIGRDTMSRKLAKSDLATIDYGLFRQFDPTGGAGERRHGRNPVAEAYLEKIIRASPGEFWASQQREPLVSQTERWIEGLYGEGNPTWGTNEVARWQSILPPNLEHRLRLVGARPIESADPQLLRKWLREAEPLVGSQATPSQKARWHRYRGVLASLAGKSAEAEAEFRAGADTLPDLGENACIYNLLLGFANDKRWAEYDAARLRYIANRKIPDSYTNRVLRLDAARSLGRK